SWELDVWGRLRRSTSAARSDLVTREEDRRALQLSLIGDVATAYFDLRAADLNLAIARRTLDSRRQTLALARRRLDQGLISELDVRQFEAEVASPAASVADFERQVAQQENALSVLVGHNPGAIARGRALTEMAARIPVPAGVPSALLGNRPDRRRAGRLPADLHDHRAVRHAEHRILPVVRVRDQHLAGVRRGLDPAVHGRPAGGGRAGQHRAGARVAGAVPLRADGARGAARSGGRARGTAH